MSLADLAAPAAPSRAIAAACEPVRATLALPFKEIVQLEFAPGLTLAEILDEAIAEGLIERRWLDFLVVWIGDAPIPRENWRLVRPKPGRLLAIRARPQGGGGSGQKKNPIATILQLIVIAVATWLSGGAAAGLFAGFGQFAGIVQAATAATVAIAGSMLVNAIAPMPQPALAGSVKQLFSLNGARNEAALYQPVIAVLGRHRMFARRAAKAFTEIVGDKVFLRLLLSWGLGPIAIEDVRIGDTPIEDFGGIEVEHKLTPADPWPGLFPSVQPDEDGVGAELTAAAGWVTRETRSDEADEIQIDFLFSEGLWRNKDSGNIGAQEARAQARYRKLGDTDWRDFETGAVASEGHTYVWSKKTQQPFRETKRRTVETRGKYEIAVRRIGEEPSDTAKNTLHWATLRSFTFKQPVFDPNAAVSAFRIEATDALNGVIDQLNAVVTRIAPKWDAETETWGAAGPTRNPGELLRWVASGPGAPRPRGPSELNDEQLGAFAALCTAKGWNCDYVLMAGASQAEVMQIVASAGRAQWVDRGGRLGVVIDDVQPAPVQMFTARNSWGFRGQLRWPPDTHALRARFLNEEKGWANDEMLVFFPGHDENTAELIETIDIPAKTNPLEVARFAWRVIAETLLRREDYTFNADIENLVAERGKRVALAHFAMVVGRKPARVLARLLNAEETHVRALQLDEIIEQTAGDNYGLKWRRLVDLGGGQGAASVETLALETVPGASREVRLAAEIPLASAPEIDDLVQFGDASIETLDVLVKDVARRSDFEAEILATPYAPAVFADDGSPLPEWQSAVAGNAFPRPPQPVIREVRATAEGIFVLFDLPGVTEWVSAIELAWRESAETGGEAAPFIKLPAIPGSRRSAAFPTPTLGKFYDLELVAVGAGGRRSKPGLVEEASLESPPDVIAFAAYPGEDSVRFVWTRVSWSGGPLDYEFREGDSFDTGVLIGHGAAGDLTIKLPTRSSGNRRFWVKTRALSGLAYSVNACEAVTYQAPLQPRNVVFEADFGAAPSPWSGYAWWLTPDTLGADTVLKLDTADGARRPHGDYREIIDLGGALYAKNWIDAAAFRVVLNDVAWADLDIAWADLGPLTWSPPELPLDGISLTAHIALEGAPADLIEAFALAGGTAGVNGTLAAAATYLTSAPMLRGAGTVRAANSELFWNTLAIPEHFTFGVDFRPSAAPADTFILFTIGNGTQWLQARWEPLTELLVLTDDQSERIELSAPSWSPGEVISIAVSQTATERRFAWVDQGDVVSQSKARALPPRGAFTELYLGYARDAVLETWADAIWTWDSPQAEQTWADLAHQIDQAAGVFADAAFLSTPLALDGLTRWLTYRGPVGFGDYRPYAAGDYAFQRASIWLRVTAPPGVADTVGVRRAKVIVDVPDVYDSGEANLIAGDNRINYARAFTVAPRPVLQQLGGAGGVALLRVTAFDLTGFNVTAFDAVNPTVPIATPCSWQASGY